MTSHRFWRRSGHAYAMSGRRAEAQTVIAELQQTAKRRYVSPYDVATIYAGLGEKEQTLAWLEKAYEDRSGWLALWLKVDPSSTPFAQTRVSAICCDASGQRTETPSGLRFAPVPAAENFTQTPKSVRSVSSAGHLPPPPAPVAPPKPGAVCVARGWLAPATFWPTMIISPSFNSPATTSVAAPSVIPTWIRTRLRLALRAAHPDDARLAFERRAALGPEAQGGVGHLEHVAPLGDGRSSNWPSSRA